VGIFLEIATTIGALAGAALAMVLHASVIAVTFGVVLIYSAYSSIRHVDHATQDLGPDRIATWLRMDGTFPGEHGLERYHVRGVPLGFAIMFVAGVLSGLLGIGSGAVKVLAMDKAMKLPFKVSTTTSNFMIGVTAAASAGRSGSSLTTRMLAYRVRAGHSHRCHPPDRKCAGESLTGCIRNKESECSKVKTWDQRKLYNLYCVAGGKDSKGG